MHLDLENHDGEYINTNGDNCENGESCSGWWPATLLCVCVCRCGWLLSIYSIFVLQRSLSSFANHASASDAAIIFQK